MTSATPNIIELRVVSKDMSAPGFDSARKRARGLAADIDGGPGSAGAAMVSADKKARGLSSTLGNVGQIAGGIMVADVLTQAAQRVTALARQTIEAASSLGESVNAVDKTFGASATRIHQWAESNATAFGLSERAFNQSATPLGSMLKNQGLAMDDVSEHTLKLTKRAADMASVFNTDVGDALVAIQAGLRGESDPLERYGVSLQAVAVDARALSDSHKTSTAQLTNQERALARLNLIYDQTAASAGDFADTSDGLANAQRIAAAEMENAQAKIGATFLPVMAAAAQVSGNLAASVGQIPGPLAAVLAGVAVTGAAMLVFAPRIMATKTALDEMAASESMVTRGLGRAAVVVGKGTAVFAAMQIAVTGLGAAMGDRAAPNVDRLTEALERYGAEGEKSGEFTNLFGDDLDQLSKDFHALGSGFTDKAARGVSEFFNSIAGFDKISPGGGLTAMKERLNGIDQALAQLVRDGKTVEAAQAFTRLSQLAKESGISIDDLRAGLPQYSSAIGDAASSTEDLAEATTQAGESVTDLQKRYKELIDSTFGLEEAQDAAADGIANLTEKVKEQVDAGVDGAASLTGNTQAARDNREAVRGLVEDYERMINEAYAAGKSTEGMAKELEDSLVKMGFSREEAARYTTQITALGTALNSLPAVTTPEVILRLTTQETFREGVRQNKWTGGIQGAASGGLRSGQTWVGEYGPEIIDLAPGSSVHSAGDSQRMARQQGEQGGGSMGYVEIGSDGSAEGDRMIRILAAAIRGRGGDPSIIGLKIRTSSA